MTGFRSVFEDHFQTHHETLATEPASADGARALGRGPAGAARRLIRGLLTLLTTGAMAMGALGAAPAATASDVPHWSIVPSPSANGLPLARFDAVSCPSAATCTAVGSAINSRSVRVPLAMAWNGRNWAVQHVPVPTGAGNTSLTGVSCVSATACTAVGQTTGSNGFSVPLAEAWNGTAWAIQTTPAPAVVGDSSLAAVSCTSATECMAAGFTTQGMPLSERWNGTAWAIEPVPSPAGADDNHLAGVSCTSAAACIAVGRVTTGENSVPGAVVWNGAAWALMPILAPSSGGRADNSLLSGVSCTTATACMAGGENRGVPLAERWNGTKWAIQPAVNPTGIGVFSGVSCTSATACTAVGFDIPGSNFHATAVLVERWNGSKWAVQRAVTPASARQGFLNGVSCASAARCTAAGYYAERVAQPTLAEHWNGTAWSIQPTPGDPGREAPNVLAAVSCAAANACFAVGSYNPTGDLVNSGSTLVERWNGTAWARQPSPNLAGGLESTLSGVSCSATTACTAVGSSFTHHSRFRTVTLAERWDGAKWAIQPTPNPPPDRATQFLAVSCTPGGACVAVGFRVNRHFTDVTLAERWNGRTWTVLPTVNPPGSTGATLAGVSCSSARKCMAVGESQTGSGSTAHQRSLAERWNGRTWSIQHVPSPAAGAFTSLAGVSCPSASACLAVGQYNDPAHGASGPLGARWNGTQWVLQPVPVPAGGQGGFLSAVSCPSAGACTAVGAYADPTGLALLAESWNGTQWATQQIPNPPRPIPNLFWGLLGLSCVSATECTAVGLREGPHQARTLAERYS